LLSPQGGFFEDIAKNITDGKFADLRSVGVFPYCFKLAADGSPELELANFCVI